MSTKASSEMVGAVKAAMDAEQKAASFYQHAADTTADPRGRDMFAQLVRFEKAHFLALSNYLASLDGPAPSGYGGSEFLKFKPESPVRPPSQDALRTDMDALTLAIEAETRAERNYRNMAGMTDQPEVSGFFSRLADEESLHKKVLEDQFYALSNRGDWTWGE